MAVQGHTPIIMQNADQIGPLHKFLTRTTGEKIIGDVHYDTLSGCVDIRAFRQGNIDSILTGRGIMRVRAIETLADRK